MGVDSNAELRSGNGRIAWRNDTEGVPERSQDVIRGFNRDRRADAGMYFDSVDDLRRGNRNNWKMPWYSINFEGGIIRRMTEAEEYRSLDEATEKEIRR